MRTIYKIVADNPTVLDIFNSMWNTEYIFGGILFNKNVILSLSNNNYKLNEAIAIFNENCKYGKVYLEEY